MACCLNHRRYRLVYESPFDTTAHVWGFCSASCEAAEEEAAQWAPEYCEGCGPDIPAYALGEGACPICSRSVRPMDVPALSEYAY